jgi:hypothetical protein
MKFRVGEVPNPHNSSRLGPRGRPIEPGQQPSTSCVPIISPRWYEPGSWQLPSWEVTHCQHGGPSGGISCRVASGGSHASTSNTWKENIRRPRISALEIAAHRPLASTLNGAVFCRCCTTTSCHLSSGRESALAQSALDIPLYSLFFTEIDRVQGRCTHRHTSHAKLP